MKVNLAGEVADGMTAQEDTVGSQGTPQFAAARGTLLGVEFGFPEALAPVGHKGAMGGTGDGVFGDACSGGKKSGDKIYALAGRGDNDTETIEVGQSGVVGL